MRALKLAALAAALAAAAVLVLVLLTLPPRAIRLDSRAPQAAIAVPGAYHVHTVRSDGTKTVEQVAALAAAAGLRFVIFADHGDGTRAPDPPAYRAGVLCLDAVEVSTDGGHYVALGLPQAPYPLGGDTRDAVADVARLRGFGVAAHPDSPKPALRWHEWGAPFDGIEWLNADSQWRDEPRSHLARIALDYLFRPPESLALLLHRPDSALRRWDALTTRRPVVGLAAADAHARLGLRPAADPYQNGASVPLPSYEAVFRTFAIEVEPDQPMSGDPARDAVLVLSAVRRGHLYSAITALAGPPRFAFTGASGRFSAREGDELPVDGPVTLQARTNAPGGASLVLLRNGTVLKETAGQELTWRGPPERGAYRVEVRLKEAPGNPPVPWIVGNPIYVGGFDRPGAFARPPAPETASLLDPASPATAWHVEQAPGSQGTVTPQAGRPPATAVAFRLGASASPFAAWVRSLQPGQLAGADRVTLRARADRPIRLSVQVRAPGNGSEGERWARSVYLDSELRTVTIFFDEMFPAGRTARFRPSLDRADSLLLVFDTVHARPGSTATVWLETVQVGRTGQ